MAHYVIGDIQGCYQSLCALLSTIEFDPQTDRITCAGDLIARGPQSLAVMQWVLAHQAVVDAVLGNHDLHFLAVAAGLKPAKDRDCTGDLLASPQLPEIIDWYRRCPLAIDLPEHQALVTHAGVWPGWDRIAWMEAMGEVSARLQSPQWIEHLAVMYGNTPAHPDHIASLDDRMRFSINAATRMRFVDRDTQALDFDHKEGPEMAPASLVPWMDSPLRVRVDRQVLFGHWAMLHGRRRNDAVFALDTGCVYGGPLTALRLEDRAVFSVEACDAH